MEQINKENILSKLSVTTFIIIYLFFCGGIYLLAYWSTFDFDITNYISFEDVPKSFLFPLSNAVGLGFIFYIFNTVFGANSFIDTIEKRNAELLPKIKELSKKELLNRVLLDFEVWAFIIFLVCFICYKPRREWVYYVATTTGIIYFFIKFTRNRTIISLFPKYIIRFFLASFLIFVPAESFMTAKQTSIAIWNNTRYIYISDIEMKGNKDNNNNLKANKLLGKLGNHLFLSDTSNSALTVLNTDEIKLIEYKKVDRSKK